MNILVTHKIRIHLNFFNMSHTFPKSDFCIHPDAKLMRNGGRFAVLITYALYLSKNAIIL